MKKSELKELLDSQRYFIIALNIYLSKIGVFENSQKEIENILDNIWLINSKIGEGIKLELISSQEIVKKGMELVALNDMYSMEIDENTKIN